MSDAKAIKHDAGKPDLSLIPMVAAIKMAEAFQVGAGRYGRYNFANGMEASRVVAALLRHTFKWFEGEEYDPDGQHHLGSVMACAAMILRMQELGTLTDDRYRPVEPLPLQFAPPKFVYSVVATGKAGKSRVSIGTYLTREEAEGHLARHRRDWPIDSFEVSIEEVPSD